MDSVVDVRECQWCHKPYRLHDGRYRYCCDECAEKARLAQLAQYKSKSLRVRYKRKSREEDDDIYLAQEWERFYKSWRNQQRRITC